ncbi:lytic transglycosylase domain-containing protein [Marilutibacter spongiae]|uniref:Transglycosylase SLT domain-containing protein n=1 Tax=Marilutibacter spongiae TaxID=2025720 RepID=A0A7W3Y6G0_9GAMM|nr:lytic transglycosylase domain-containing protein [Lysobacter spongiae]MBB1061079.1 transglycosylase SLT domain-containing protein [Lysobacter spongiae]
MRRATAWAAGFLTGLGMAASALATEPSPTGTAEPAPAAVEPVAATPPPVAPATRNGREIYDAFRDGLSDSQCDDDVSDRWSRHFAQAPQRLAQPDDTLLPLFGYVVDKLRESHLPTEYALIPFVESGYKPGARSPAGPAGMWQMIKLTARNHKVPISSHYDGRLSPVDSTRAAVRYIKTLHGMFAGDWRLAVMAYNAGEYRVFGALRRNGLAAREASPEQLPGMPGITQAYVRKIHALSCLIVRAGRDEDWLKALDRPVARLRAVPVPDGTQRIDQFAASSGQSIARLQRLNPVHADGRIRQPATGTAYLLAAAGPGTTAVTGTPAAPATMADASAYMAQAAPLPAGHVVARGENPWTIAKRYDLSVSELLQRNDLARDSVLQVGQRLRIAERSSVATPADPAKPLD